MESVFVVLVATCVAMSTIGTNGVPWAWRFEVVSCSILGTALSFVGDASQHLHFSRGGGSLDCGLAMGGSLIPMILLVKAAACTDDDDLECRDTWKRGFSLSVLMTGMVYTWLFALKMESLMSRGASSSYVRKQTSTTAKSGMAVVYTAAIFGFHGIESNINGVATIVALCVFGASAWSLAVLAPQSFTLGEAMLCVQSSALLAMCVVLKLGHSPIGDESEPATGRAVTIVTVTLLAGGLFLVQVWLPVCTHLCRTCGGTTATTEAPLNRTRSPIPDSNNRMHTSNRTYTALSSEMGEVSTASTSTSPGLRSAVGMNVLLAAGVSVVLGPIMSVTLGELSPLWLGRYILGTRRHLYCASNMHTPPPMIIPTHPLSIFLQPLLLTCQHPPLIHCFCTFLCKLLFVPRIGA
eukprot:m.768992 g.768992  ORF g.768992 m.768992 type:complete len:409 (+) comp23233_c0_seq9:139-1365(+)